MERNFNMEHTLIKKVEKEAQIDWKQVTMCSRNSSSAGRFQKQPPDVFLEISQIFTKTPVLESLFNKVAGVQVFFCEICEILRILILKKICERLLIKLTKDNLFHECALNFHQNVLFNISRWLFRNTTFSNSNKFEFLEIFLKHIFEFCFTILL